MIIVRRLCNVERRLYYLDELTRERVLCHHITTSETFRGPRGHRSQCSVHFAGRRAQYEVTQSSPGDGDVLVGAEDVDLAVGQHYPGLGDVLDGKFSPPTLPRQSPNRSGQGVALQSRHVLDLETVDEQVVQSDDGQGVLHLEPADEGLNIGK